MLCFTDLSVKDYTLLNHLFGHSSKCLSVLAQTLCDIILY